MESWSYVPEEEEHLFPGETDFSFDALMINRKALVEWDNKVPSNFEKNGFISERDVAKNMDFVYLGFPNIFQKSFHGSQPLEPSSNCVLDSNSMGEEESESKHSSSPLESRSHNSFLIDLNLGRLADCKGASSDKIAKGELSLTSIHPATAAKRARTCGNPTHAPVCQVYGCNLDLSSSKEYHKRHKVCDVHSKTAKVIVNGTEQRFCQQCSRFHLLAEFDDGKRSCRRRLAGHNERRRKPQFDYMSNKQHKILQSYEGTKYLGSTTQKRPQFAFQDLYRSGFYDLGKYVKASHNGHIKLEEETCASQLAAAPGQELSRFSFSDSALSLLSAQSQNPSGNPLDRSSACHGICLHHSDDQVHERPLAINSLDKYVLNKSFPLNSNEAGHALQFQVQKDNNNCQPSHLLNAKCQFPSEHGATTVDLLQLSSHLKRVEHQRNSFQVKWENEDCF